MKILVITGFYYPDHAGIAPLASDFCNGLAARGHQVTTFTTHPFYPEWQRKSEASPWRVQRESINDVDVWRYGLFIPSKPSGLIPRLLHEASFALSLLRSLTKWERYDAVIVFCPQLSTVLYAAIRKVLRREPLWLNVQDIPADAAMTTGISRSGLFGRLGSTAQRVLFKFADQWSSIAPSMVDRLEQLNSKGRPIHLCPNWLTGTLAECVSALPSKLSRHVGRPIRLQYAGNIGKKQGLLDFCKFLQATEADFEFRINGNGGEADTVRQWVENTNDPRFRFGEFLDEANFTRVLHEADVFVITEKKGVGPSFIPSKLIPCISSGTPVACICDRHGPLGHEVTEHDLGVVIEWKDLSDQFPWWLQQLVDDADLTRRLQENCLVRARVYSRENALERFEHLIQEMTAGEGQPQVLPAA